MGCWAIGGPMWMDGKVDGWGQIDDAESLRAIRCALDLGITFFDTADVYGTGHSEHILGQALHDCRHKIIIATKFGYTYDEARRHITGTDVSPAYIRRACEASLKRLRTDTIDLYQLHCGATPDEVAGILEALEKLRAEGKIRACGWSTDDPRSAQLFATSQHCAAVQHDLNVFINNDAMLDLCDEFDLASINRSPLASGFLSGKYSMASTLPADDFRAAGHAWVAYFEDGRPKPEFLRKLAAIRDILTSNGRTPAQGALAWLWAKSERTIPIPGFKTVKQVEENCAALNFGPLTTQQMQEVNSLLSSFSPLSSQHA